MNRYNFSFMHRNNYYNISNITSFRLLKTPWPNSLLLLFFEHNFHHLHILTKTKNFVEPYSILISVVVLFVSNFIIIAMFLAFQTFLFLLSSSVPWFLAWRICIIWYECLGYWKYVIYLRISIFWILDPQIICHLIFSTFWIRKSPKNK